MRENKETNPVRDLRRKKLEELELSYNELVGYEHKKLALQYQTFFIPGWTGENCSAWMRPYDKIKNKYRKYYLPAKHWIEKIVANKEQAYFINLEKESAKSQNFIELGKHLKRRLLNIATDGPINLVGHSMGGLDIRAAIIDDSMPKLNVKNVITVGTPNQGTGEPGLFGFQFVRNLINKFKKLETYQIAQGYSMFSKGKFVKMINTIENRLKLLNNVGSFYVLMGLRDAVVKGSTKLDLTDIDENVSKKVSIIQTSSADHSNEDGITQDPRLFLPTIKILCGIELEDDWNRGYIYRKNN
jgi:hypothetical protein